MTPRKYVRSAPEVGREIHRLPIIRNKFRRKSTLVPQHFMDAVSRLNAKGLVSFVISYFARLRRFTALPCHTVLSVQTPSGWPAVRIYAPLGEARQAEALAGMLAKPLRSYRGAPVPAASIRGPRRSQS